MKKLELKRGDIKEVLTRDQMKMITGGDYFPCYALNSDGEYASGPLPFYGDNCCGAQATADFWAFSSSESSSYPYGLDCPCADEC